MQSSCGVAKGDLDLFVILLNSGFSKFSTLSNTFSPFGRDQALLEL